MDGWMVGWTDGEMSCWMDEGWLGSKNKKGRWEMCEWMDELQMDDD